MEIASKDKALLLEGTPQERTTFFHPGSMTQEEFPYRFLLWCKFYGGGLDFPWSFAPVHFEWGEYFAEMLYSEEQNVTKLILSSRDMLKTYLAKRLIAYIHLYERSKFTYFVSSQMPKVRDEMDAIGNILRDRMITADYGKVWETINKDEISLQPFKGEEVGSKIHGSTLTSFPRGITANNFKPQFLVVDDFESRQTLRSGADTMANYQKYQSDILSSLDNVSRRVLIIGNHLSIHGNHQKLLDSLDEDSKMIVPLYNLETKEPTWGSRFTWDTEEAMNSVPKKVSITAKKKEYEDQPGGEKMFREEYLANPLGFEELYYDVRKIEEIYKPESEPMQEYEDLGIKYRIYKPVDTTKLYVAGLDLGEGIGEDSTALVLIAFNAGSAEIVVTADSNTVKQKEFCASNLRFFQRYGARPYFVPESNMGGSYIEELTDNYPHELIYKRDYAPKRGMKQQKIAFGLLRNQLTTRVLLAETLKTQLESGSLINHCRELHNEITQYSHTDHTTPFGRVTAGDVGTQHFDLLSAAQNAAYGLIQASKFFSKDRQTLPPLNQQPGWRNRKTTLERVSSFE